MCFLGGLRCGNKSASIAGKVGVVLMSRTWLLGLVVLLAASALGCTACGTPFDYCSATYNPQLDPCGGCDDCRESVRLGSILSDDSIAPLSYNAPIDEPTPADDESVPPTEELPEPDDSMLPDLEPPDGSEPSTDEELMPLEDPSAEPLEEMPEEAPAEEDFPTEELPAVEPLKSRAPSRRVRAGDQRVRYGASCR